MFWPSGFVLVTAPLAREVKKYEIYDGITFQWFMCAGILMVGFVSSVIFGDFGMKAGPSRDPVCSLVP